MWWNIPVNPVRKRLKPEDFEFRVSLGYILSSFL